MSMRTCKMVPCMLPCAFAAMHAAAAAAAAAVSQTCKAACAHADDVVTRTCAMCMRPEGSKPSYATGLGRALSSASRSASLMHSSATERHSRKRSASSGSTPSRERLRRGARRGAASVRVAAAAGAAGEQRAAGARPAAQGACVLRPVRPAPRRSSPALHLVSDLLRRGGAGRLRLRGRHLGGRSGALWRGLCCPLAGYRMALSTHSLM